MFQQINMVKLHAVVDQAHALHDGVMPLPVSKKFIVGGQEQ